MVLLNFIIIIIDIFMGEIHFSYSAEPIRYGNLSIRSFQIIDSIRCIWICISTCIWTEHMLPPLYQMRRDLTFMYQGHSARLETERHLFYVRTYVLETQTVIRHLIWADKPSGFVWGKRPKKLKKKWPIRSHYWKKLHSKKFALQKKYRIGSFVFFEFGENLWLINAKANIVSFLYCYTTYMDSLDGFSIIMH